MLSAFAKESNNNISDKYTNIVNSIRMLAIKNPEIKKILDTRHEDEVSKHMRLLIEEHKKTPTPAQSPA